jgi:hypothetical protein
MFTNLRILKWLLFWQPSAARHSTLDHKHWDRETRTWRSHQEIVEREAA